MTDDHSKDREEFWKNITPEYFTNNTLGHGGNSKKKRIALTKRRKMLSRFVREWGITSALELGCNNGANLTFLSEHNPSLKLAGLDICERAIKHAKEVEGCPADLFVGSIYDLSRFEDNSFDMVFTCAVLLHINHDKAKEVMREMVRIARKKVVHLERQTKRPKILSYAHGEIPHAFSHNFIRSYAEIGIKAYLRPISELTRNAPVGGADDLIVVNIEEKIDE